MFVPVDDGPQRGGQPGVGIDGVQLAGFDQRGADGPVLRARIVAGEEGVLSVEGDGGMVRSTALLSISEVPLDLRDNGQSRVPAPPQSRTG